MSRNLLSKLLVLSSLLLGTLNANLAYSIENDWGSGSPFDQLSLPNRLCGQPSLIPPDDHSDNRVGENVFTISTANYNWLISVDDVAYKKLVNLLAHSHYPNVCVPIDDWSALSTNVPYPVKFFVFWDSAGSGVSVSNQ